MDRIGLGHCWHHLTKPPSTGNEAGNLLMKILSWVLCLLPLSSKPVKLLKVTFHKNGNKAKGNSPEIKVTIDFRSNFVH